MKREYLHGVPLPFSSLPHSASRESLFVPIATIRADEYVPGVYEKSPTLANKTCGFQTIKTQPRKLTAFTRGRQDSLPTEGTRFIFQNKLLTSTTNK
jgi:hypothetical protein